VQIGTRWLVHTECPVALAPEILYAIAEQEAELRPLKVDTSQWRWTLTYLEGRPIVTLDDGTTIRISAGGNVTVTQE
jgi:hypothetical protein